MFVRATPGTTKAIRVKIHHAYPADLQLRLEINGRGVRARSASADDGRKVLLAIVPDELMQQHDGRLWVRIGFTDAAGNASTGHVSLMRFELCEAISYAAELEHTIDAKDELIERQAQIIAAKDELIQQQVKIIATRDELIQQQVRIIAAKDESIQQRAAQVAELEHPAAAKRVEVGQLRERLDQQALRQAQLEQELQSIYGSRTWRLTSPLRKFRTWLYE